MAVGKGVYLILETSFLMSLETLTDAGNESFKHKKLVWPEESRLPFAHLSMKLTGRGASLRSRTRKMTKVQRMKPRELPKQSTVLLPCRSQIKTKPL